MDPPSMASVPPFTRGMVSPLARAFMVCGKLTVGDNLEKRRDSVLGDTKRSRTSDLMEVGCERTGNCVGWFGVPCTSR